MIQKNVNSEVRLVKTYSNILKVKVLKLNLSKENKIKNKWKENNNFPKSLKCCW